MKILIVDDESRKLKKIKAVLRKVNGITEDNLIHVLDLNEAKKTLVEHHVDLLILDLKIPELLGDENDQNEIAGLNFIDEIIEVEKYIKPKDIVIVTEYDELIEKSLSLDREISFPIIKYDESTVDWEKTLISKVSYSLLYEKNKEDKNLSYDFDIAIITAVDVEAKAVERLYDNWKLCYKPKDPSIYYTNIFSSRGKKCKVVMSQQAEMGMAAASTLTSKIIYHFRPQYVIMVGITAGIGKDKNLGDIIVANEVWNYSSGKYIGGSEGENLLNFLPDPKSLSLDPKVQAQVSMDYAQILFSIKNQWLGDATTELKLHIGPLACGSAVVANDKVIKELVQSHSRKTIGVDMESYGVFYASTNGAGSRTIPICVKSICDFADFEKNDKTQKYAAYTSAQFAKYLIENVLEFPFGT